MDWSSSSGRWRVVVNSEEQYSIWPADREPPSGWQPDGVEGTRDACLDHIATVWTDMRPKGLREWMEAHADMPPAPPESELGPPLLEVLSHTQPTRAVVTPADSVEAFRAALSRGVIHLSFPNTRGGTVLRIAVDSYRDDSQGFQIEGHLVLDGQRASCRVQLDHELSGTGRLVLS
jgi:uncharacterized protein YbdZ (MbtH family)